MPSPEEPSSDQKQEQVQSSLGGTSQLELFSAPSSGQMILGTDKRNPIFTVYTDGSKKHLLVYYGFELLEIVSNDRNDPNFKLLLGRLYNAGIKLATLCETFEVDPKTIRRWGNALTQGDPENLVRVLEGRNAARKLTPEIRKFAHFRWPDLISERTYGAVAKLQNEILRVFDVSISRSGLIDLIRELKGEIAPEELTVLEETEKGEGEAGEASETAPEALEKRENSVSSGEVDPAEKPAFDAPKPDDTDMGSPSRIVSPAPFLPCPTPPQIDEPSPSENTMANSASEVETWDVDANSLPSVSVEASEQGMLPPMSPGANLGLVPYFPKDPAPAFYVCEHAGLFLFAKCLEAITNVTPVVQPILAQWMAALWLGAQNIEQTKYLNWEDLELILDRIVRFPTPQRQCLQTLSADSDLIRQLFRFNWNQLEKSGNHDYYFDPHTKQYTGDQNVLKGWCPKIRGADKAMHSDFIHTIHGEPVYFETTDNFEDLRTRISGVTLRASQVLQWEKEQIPTFILDRGIYGQDLFKQVLEEGQFHLITWEKGFKPEPWTSEKVMGTTTITRCRNSSKDLRHYTFDYCHRPWEKNPQMTQIVVMATNDRGRSIQVGVISSNRDRAPDSAIHLIFNRWLQENDFKYLDKHFGINQITSYRSVDYSELKEWVSDREVKSAERKALDLKIREAKKSLKDDLLAQEISRQSHLERNRKIEELEKERSQMESQIAPEYRNLTKKISSLKAVEKRSQKTQEKRRKKIDQGHQQIVEIEIQITKVKGTESRLETMIQEGKVKLDGQCKRMMDVLKITARNTFYKLFQPFKKSYDNYRDDHDHFRSLTQSSGVLEVSQNEILVHLFPPNRYKGVLGRANDEALKTINDLGLDHPCQPGRKLKFRLGHRSELEVKMILPV